jgi:hypothetical protein
MLIQSWCALQGSPTPCTIGLSARTFLAPRHAVDEVISSVVGSTPCESIATSQQMVSTTIVAVWLSCFNMGLHCSMACCLAAHAWCAFLQFTICYPTASQLNATRVDWVDLCCHHSSSMGFLYCLLSGSNIIWLYQWQLGVEMSSIKDQGTVSLHQ